ncbi:MAG: cysteine--tRNA ligase [Kofleriaceae bacterium]
MTQLRLYDSMRQQKVPFEPLQPGKVGMYVCGPTPYAPAHLGHAFSAISFDTIRRGLEFLGFDVKYVRNITDVEDKIINAANAIGEDPMALAARFAADYNRDMARFGVRSPTVEPLVSTHIAEIIALTQKLITNGKAYATDDGDVYFSVESFPTYGKLSKQSIDDLQKDASGRELIEKHKRSFHDFALWKAAKPGEPSWDSPWGKGRPGWHIECSAMTHSHLGETFDIHGGGKDLIFPHHENEIAQSQGAYGEESFARHWMHNGFLNLNGVKMSKSLGNVFNCDPLANHAGGEALRFFCVKHHYRSPVEFEVEAIPNRDTPTELRFHSLYAADRDLSYFYETLVKLDAFVANGGDGGDGAVLPEIERVLPAVREAMLDDFNAPRVLAAMHDAATLGNKLAVEGKGIDKALRRRTIARIAKDLRTAGRTIGLLEGDPQVYLRERRQRLVSRSTIDLAQVERLLAERATARAAKDFSRSDAIRGELTALGVELLDTPQGTDWRVLDGAGGTMVGMQVGTR